MCPLEAHVWTTPSWVLARLNDDTKALMGFPKYVPGYDSTSRPPHRDSAKRFWDDSLRFAWDTMIVRSNKRYVVAFFVLVIASTQRVYEHALLKFMFILILGFTVGIAFGTHSVLCRLKI